LAIQKLHDVGYHVGVRAKHEDPNYGEHIEEADAVAGDIPTSYSEVPNINALATDKPEAMSVFPATATIAPAATVALVLVKGDAGTEGDLSITDITKNAAVEWTSATPGVATVDTDGVVTGVGQGTSVITARYEYDPGEYDSATCTVTVS
jgi:uncharacterized protein YjdB